MQAKKKAMSMDELIADVFAEVSKINDNLSKMNDKVDRVYGVKNSDPLVDAVIFLNSKYDGSIGRIWGNYRKDLRGVDFVVTSRDKQEDIKRLYRMPHVVDLEALARVYDVDF